MSSRPGTFLVILDQRELEGHALQDSPLREIVSGLATLPLTVVTPNSRAYVYQILINY